MIQNKSFESSRAFFREIVTLYHFARFFHPVFPWNRYILSFARFFHLVFPWNRCIMIIIFFCFCPQGTGISEEVFRQIETVQNRYDSSTAAAFRAVQKSGEMVVRTLDPRQFIRLASETAPKINIDTNVSSFFFKFIICASFFHPVFLWHCLLRKSAYWRQWTVKSGAVDCLS